MSVTASAVTNTFSQPGYLTGENFADLLTTQFDMIKDRKWKAPIQGKQFFALDNTSKDVMYESSIGGFGLMPESDDEDALPLDHAIPGLDVSHTPIDYRLAVRIKARLRETDQYGKIAKIQSMLAQSPVDTLEYILADAFNTGFGSNASWLCGDGMYLFDSGRYYEDNSQGTWSNLEEAGSLTQGALATMRQNFRKNLNERGIKRPLIMKRLIVPVDLEDTAREIITSDNKAVEMSNTANVYKDKFEIYVWDYLTSTTAWFGSTNIDDLYELKLIWRIKPQSGSNVLSDNPQIMQHWVRMSCVTGCARPHSIRGNAGA